MKYQSFIGLEVHIHLLTKTKVFCNCAAAFGGEPNSHVCPVCMGYPGVLPSLNIEALRMGCTVAKALHCSIPERTWFERKQYFYPDMPKNYQISQFASPLGQQGWLDLEGQNGDRVIKKRVRIKECHLEEDAGKMIHTGTVSLLDYNRAGVSLLEIVTEPDLETGEEAELFIRRLRRMVRYLGVCDGNMEEGSLRADANVSINLPGKGLGRKVEIKNLNSSRFVRLALNHEIIRQGGRLDAGQTVVQETRLWNENRDQTEPMRQKENAQDYRYFPEPDLPVFSPDAAFLKLVEDSLVELPQDRVKRFTVDYGLSEEQADLIADEKAGADYFEAAISAALARGLDRVTAAGRIANWFLTDIRRILHRENLQVQNIGGLKLNPQRLASLVVMLEQGRIGGKIARQTAELSLAEDRDPEEIIAEKGWEQISDPVHIAALVKTVLAAERTAVEELRAAEQAAVEELRAAEQATVKELRTAAAKSSAKGSATGSAKSSAKRAAALRAYLVGKVLAATGGRADPKIAGELIGEQV
ncbi:MAG: Asp-tRNA(Asn)/Glu-tRNA(Gln) amidotransferase subunit GatB [Treponema sp.]|jgi:aspartyl-tRNA(Asn)/glutamyl-tRNA(Gln) amidotransferase subunit B|nr:Asp-tRNA(Asn)/Glu-tRNA(Gln) amidotransferase subunit GatB [Treponema sp.]